MATVKLTSDIIETIQYTTRRIHEAEREKVKYFSEDIGDYPGDTFAEWLLPADKRDELLAATPVWLRQYTNCYNIKLYTSPDNDHFSPWLYVPTKDLEINLHNKYCNYFNEKVGTPGIEHIDNVTHGFVVALSDGGESLPKSKLRNFLIEVHRYVEDNRKITESSKAAVDTMTAFLRQHNTLQSAMKEFGPSLSFYLEPWLLEEYKREPPKRTRKPKSDAPKSEPINVDSLIVKATASKLNI